MFSADAYRAARERAARLDRFARGRIVVSGADRASYLQGLLTNDVAALASGRGCYAAYLTAQGRMIADLYVYELGDVILLTVPRRETAAVLEKLDQFVFGEDVQLGDVSDAFATTAIVGPDAARVVSGLIGIAQADLSAWPEHGNGRGRFGDSAVIVTRGADTGEDGYDVHVPIAGAARWQEALDDLELPRLSEDAAETLRIEAGVPLFGRDMDQDTIPLEAGIETRAISFSKGCYVGQEVIIRVLHRGHGRVVRKLVGLLCDGEAGPPAGATLTADGREAGRVTSSAWSIALAKPIALAYLHRDFLTPGTTVSIGDRSAVVHPLPFVP
jgi:folate-binding protein YgfZ